MPRALLEFRRALPAVTLVAPPVQDSGLARHTWWRDAASLKILGREYLKYLAALAHLRFERPVAIAAEPDSR